MSRAIELFVDGYPSLADAVADLKRRAPTIIFLRSLPIAEGRPATGADRTFERSSTPSVDAEGRYPIWFGATHGDILANDFERDFVIGDEDDFQPPLRTFAHLLQVITHHEVWPNSAVAPAMRDLFDTYKQSNDHRVVLVFDGQRLLADWDPVTGTGNDLDLSERMERME